MTLDPQAILVGTFVFGYLHVLGQLKGLSYSCEKVIHRLSGGATLDGIGDIGGGLRTRVVRSALQSINLTLEWHQLIFVHARFLIYDQIDKHM